MVRLASQVARDMALSPGACCGGRSAAARRPPAPRGRTSADRRGRGAAAADSWGRGGPSAARQARGDEAQHEGRRHGGRPAERGGVEEGEHVLGPQSAAPGADRPLVWRHAPDGAPHIWGVWGVKARGVWGRRCPRGERERRD